jgi:hypothetical protein
MELRRKLVELGIDTSRIHFKEWQRGQTGYHLYYGMNRWRVEDIHNGTVYEEAKFKKESKACAYLLNALTEADWDLKVRGKTIPFEKE